MLRADLQSPHGKEHLRYREEQIPSKAQDCWVLRCPKARHQTRTGLGATSLLAPPPGHLLQAPGPLSRAPGFSQPPGQHRVLWGRELAKLVLVVPSFHSLTHMLSLTPIHMRFLTSSGPITGHDSAAWETCPATHTPPSAPWTGTKRTVTGGRGWPESPSQWLFLSQETVAPPLLFAWSWSGAPRRWGTQPPLLESPQPSPTL